MDPSIESLEARRLLSGAIQADVVGGVLRIDGDAQANQLIITRENGDRTTYRLATPDLTTTINGSTNSLVIRDATAGLSIDLGGGADELTLSGVYVRGRLSIDTGADRDHVILRSVRVTSSVRFNGAGGDDQLVVRNSIFQGDVSFDGGAGKDRTTLSLVITHGQLNISDTTGASIIRLAHLSAKDDTQIATGGSLDRFTVLDSTFTRDLSATLSGGDDEVFIRNTVTRGRSTIDAGSGDNHIDREVILGWDFNKGSQGWQTGFADYDPNFNSEEDLELAAGIVSAKAETGFDRKALKLSGNNLTDDLLLYITRRIGQSAGVVPGQAYNVRFTVRYLSNRPMGSIGQTEYLKVGAVNHPIERSIDPDTGLYTLNIDRGNQAVGGADASVIGPVTNRLEDEDRWRQITVIHNRPSPSTADADGQLFLFLGTEATFEVPTAMRYAAIGVRLTPVFD